MKRRPPSVQPPSSRISQAVEKRLRGEHAGIGDFEDALRIGQESHAVFPATPHRIRLQGDGTSLRFVIRRGAWVARFPGEHSLSLGTSGLHDESPLGFNDHAVCGLVAHGGRFYLLRSGDRRRKCGLRVMGFPLASSHAIRSCHHSTPAAGFEDAHAAEEPA
jgi:hypothetical protein